MLKLNTGHTGNEEEQTIEKKEVINPIIEAKRKIEERLTSMEGKLYNYALQASMIGTAEGTVSPISLESTDGFDDQENGDIERFYEDNGYQFRGVRTFAFDCLGQQAPIEYRFNQKIENGTLVNIYERFSERFTTTIQGEEFTFESMEDVTNFIYHMHRAIKFKKGNDSVTYSQGQANNEEGKIMVDENEYYRAIPKTRIGLIDENGTITYRSPAKKTETTYGPTMDREGNVKRKFSNKTVHYNQSYHLKTQQQTEGKTADKKGNTIELHDSLSIEKIVQALNNS